MATQTATQTSQPKIRLNKKAPVDFSSFVGCSSPLFEAAKKDRRYNDWRDDLVRDGVAVVKGAIPEDRANQYADRMLNWLEDFQLGFDRNDPNTVHADKLPAINEKGMCFGYGVSHEQFAWDVRQEQGVIEAFEKVYEDKDLIVSFDSVGFSFPNRKDLPPNKAWPHQDQDPEKGGFRCLQGLVNILPNGPDDGGLIVCKGAHLVSEEFHEEFKNEEDPVWAWTKEWYGFTSQGMNWLENRGFKWEKICAGPGDLIVWDSRLPHYNLSPTKETPRFCVYTCYMPVKDCSQEDLVKKKDAFYEFRGTSHWPNALQINALPVLRNGQPDPHNRVKPASGAPKLSERGFQLTGIPYIKAEC
ncbi:hypothetical protein DM02DRAFT_684233 [Periconia macrospinosa]|uniref:Phytanoyl-CoA dioxygenase n=1 Tax=Periconia macrospinosa TaxID=97972 RepID=A0A2V1E5D7_9PLEO|nr:hypothetical protein DM02DRAFT_684233 [Periconia macrospinosa]